MKKKPIYLLIFSDSPRGRIITGCDIKTSNEYWDRTKYLTCNEEVYNYINSSSQQVDLGIGYIKVDSNCTEVTDISSFIKEEAMFEDEEELETYKKSYLLRAKRILDTRMANDTLVLDFYKYLMCKEDLEYEGYVINKHTEDSIYQEIVQTQNEKLISYMENYLEAKKNLSSKQSWYNIFRKFETRLNKCQSKEELEEIFNEYSEKFF